MKHYLFKEHADASFYGRGPWKIGEVHASGWLKMIPVDPDGFAYGTHVLVDPMDFHLTFEKVYYATHS